MGTVKGYTEGGKMTFEEALEIIRQHETAITRGTSKNTLALALCVAEKALEKEIPKSPFREDGLMICPVCKRTPFGAYCLNCGQRLEWGKIEEEE